MSALKNDAGRIVVVGASLAGLRAAETLRAEGYGGEVVVVGDEEHEPYDRPPLSKEILTGEMAIEEARLPRVGDVEITWRLGTAAVGLDPDRQVVRLADGDGLGYDGLVLATGSSARRLTVFEESDTVHVIRTVDDALRLRRVLTPEASLLVVGCGFVGIEVASSARALGADVTVVGLDPPLAPAGPLVSEAASRLLRRNDVAFHVGQGVSGVTILDDGRHEVTLTDGTVVHADHTVLAVGSEPSVAWLADSGLPIDDGVVCEATLHVVDHRTIVAAGDIVRWPHRLFGASLRVEHWSNAVEQGVAAARSLLRGDVAEPFVGVPSFWSDHFGTRLQSVGVPSLGTRFEVVDGDPESGTFAAAAYAGDEFVGAVAYGMPRAMAKFRIRLVRAGAEAVRTAG